MALTSYRKITEQKRHINKPDEFYPCDELHREDGYLVVKYDVTRAGRIGLVEIPAGSLTIAHYWANAGYVLWEMYDPERKLIGYCYHLCLPPKIGPTHVEYLDLLLDLWFDPEGQLTVLDEEELQQAAEAGKVGPDELRLIACERENIQQTHPTIIAGLWRPPDGVAAL